MSEYRDIEELEDTYGDAVINTYRAWYAVYRALAAALLAIAWAQTGVRIRGFSPFFKDAKGRKYD